MIADSEPESSSLAAARRALLERALRGEAAPTARSSISPRPREDRAPLTAGQRQLWLLTQMAADVPVYNEAVTIRIPEELDFEALRRAIDGLMLRQEAWRATFIVEDGEPVQVIHPTVPFPLPHVDLRRRPAGDRLVEALKLAEEDARRPFDLAASPPVRALLVSLDSEDHLLFMTFHHIVFDGVTVQSVLLPELDALYHSNISGTPLCLTDPQVRFGDYAHWQSLNVAGKSVQSQLEYWAEHLAGELPMLTLPATRRMSDVESYDGATRYLQLGLPLSDGVRRLAQAAGITPFMTLLAAFSLLLHRFSGQDDVIVGTVVSTRSRSELEHLAGYFLNTLALRVDVSGNPTIDELLQRVRTVVVSAFDHQDVPFELVVQRVRPDRRGGKTPLIQTVMTLEPPVTELNSGWTASRMDVDTGTAKFDLGLYFSDGPNGLIGRFEYSLDLFAEGTVTQMMDHFRLLVAGMVDDPSCRVSQLPALTEEEDQLLREWNGTHFPLPSNRRFFDAFVAQAAETPDTIALADSVGTMTYRDLDRRSNKLAHFLRSRGATSGSPIAVHLNRSVDLVVALLGILKSGAAYLPLDASYPAERIEYVLRDSGVSMIVTEESTLALLPPGDILAICIDSDGAAIADQPDEPLTAAGSAEDPAYVIYTSGSTGKPKGVVVSHRNVINLLSAVQRRLQLSPRDIMLAVTSPAFDISVTELFLPLITGGQVVIAGRDIVADPRALLKRLARSRATIMQATPATWRAIVEGGWPPAQAITVLTAGEALSVELAARLMAGATAVWNLYGPTETTIYSTAHRVQPSDDPVPIGRPIDNTQTYIIDRNRRQVPPGVSGELYIGGAGVSHGYLGKPELTAERFLPDPVDLDSSGSIYRTGDVCRWRSDGTIDYLGRSDHQVKVRGYRIELGEIELMLRRQPGVDEAVVITRDDVAGEKQLLAFVTAQPGAVLSGKETRQGLELGLPAYMVPARIAVLEAFPLTPNGKIDRRALEALDYTPEPSVSTPPHTLTEELMASIWADLLEVEVVGVDEDFFELGGHSLLAVRMLERIRTEFGRTVSLNTLFTTPTIAAMARALDTSETEGTASLISPLRTSGHRRPFFLLHGQPKGRGLYSVKLARLLDAEQPLYVLQPHALVGLTVPPSIEEIAADYVAAMRSYQAHGPYRIGGFCLSGIVAYEMAQQLRDVGEEVEMLVLLHTKLPRFIRSVPIRMALDVAGTVVRASDRTRMDWFSGLQDAYLYTLRAFRRRRAARTRPAGAPEASSILGDLPEPTLVPSDIPTEPRHRGMDPYLWAMAVYTLRPYDGSVTLLRSWRECKDDLTNGWGRLVANLEAFDVPPHVTVLREEVQELSERLEDVLSRSHRFVVPRHRLNR